MPDPLSKYINPSQSTNPMLASVGKSLTEYVQANDNSYNQLFATYSQPIDQSKYLPYTKLLTGQNFDVNRALNQSNSEQIRRLFIRGGAEAISNLGQAFGYLTDLPEIFSSQDNFDNEITQMSRDWLAKVKENNKDYTPILHENAGFDPASLDWWLANGDSIIGSLGYFALGAGIGVAAETIMGTLANIPMAMNLINTAKIVKNFGSAITAATAMNYSETMQIATDTYYNILKQGGDKKSAAEEASKVVRQGKWTIALEIPQYVSILKGIKTIGSRSFSNLTKNALLDAGKEYAEQFGFEGGEEIFQGWIQNEAERNGLIKSKKLKDDGTSKTERFIEYLASSDAKASGLLGGIGGVAFSGIRDIASNIYNNGKTPESNAREEISRSLPELIDLFKQNSKLAEDKLEEDFLAAEKTQKKELLNLALHKAKTGTYKQFINTIDVLSNMTEEEAASHDLDFNSLKENAAAFKKDALYLEKLHNQVEIEFGGSTEKHKLDVLNTLYNKVVFNEQINSISNEISSIYNDRSSTKLSNQKLHELVRQKNALEKQLETVREKLTKASEETVDESEKVSKNKDNDQFKRYEKFLEKTLNSTVKEIENEKLFQKNSPQGKKASLLGQVKGDENTDVNNSKLEDNFEVLAQNEFAILELDNKYKHLKTDSAKKEYINKEKEEKEALNEEIKNKIKIFDKKPFNDIIDEINTGNIDHGTSKKLKESYEKFKKTKTFQDLSEDEKAEIVENFKLANEKIENEKNTPGRLISDDIFDSNLKNSSIDDNAIASKETITLLTGKKRKTKKDILVITHPSDEKVKDLNKSGNKAYETSPNESVRRKKEIISFARLNIDYIIDKDGNIVNLTDKGKLKFIESNDPRVDDYKKFLPNQEIEIVIDEDFAKKNGIELTEENWWRIPYGIKAKDGVITAWVHKFNKEPNNKELDQRIIDLIRPSLINENYDPREIAQVKLIEFRKFLFDSLIKQGKEKINGQIDEKTTGYIHYGEVKRAIDVFGDGEKLAEDVYFGVIDDLGNVITNDNKINHKYAVRGFYDIDSSSENSGSLVVLLPTNVVEEGNKTVLMPQYLTVDNIDKEYAKIAAHIIYNFDNINKIKEIEGLPKDIDTFEDLLGLIIYNGKNTGNIYIKVDPKNNVKTLYLSSYKDENTGNVSWEKHSSIEVTPENKDKIMEALMSRKFNIKINSKNGYNFSLEKGKLTISSQELNSWIADRSSSQIESRDLNNGRKQFFFQPVITFKVDGFNNETDKEKTLNIITKKKKPVSVKKEILKSDEPLENPILIEPEDFEIDEEDIIPEPKSKKTKEKNVSEDLDDLHIPTKEEIKAYNNLPNDSKKFIIKNYRVGVEGIFNIIYSDDENIDKLWEHSLKRYAENNNFNSYTWLGNLLNNSKSANLEKIPLGAINRSNKNFLEKLEKSENKLEYLSKILSNADSETFDLSLKIFKIFGDKNIDISFYEKPTSNVVATAIIGDKPSIKINSHSFIRSSREHFMIILHEMLHLVTINAIDSPITEEEKKFKKEIERLYEYVKTNLTEEYRGLLNVKEFISEAFSNPEFKNKLKSLKYKEENKSLFARLINYIKNLFKSKQKTVYDLVSKYTNSYLDNAQLSSTENSANIYEIYLNNKINLDNISKLLSNINYLALYELKKNPTISKDELYDRVRRMLITAKNEIEKVGLKNSQGYKDLDLILSNSGDNELYKDLVNKSKIYLDNQILILKDFETNLETLVEAEESVKNNSLIFGKEVFELNSKDSASKRLKYRLSFIPEGYFNSKGVAKPKRNMYNMYSFVPFDVTYDTIINILSDKNVNEFMPALKKIAEYNPNMSLFYEDLKRASESDNLNDKSYYKEFMSHFQKQKSKMIDVLTKIEEDNSLSSLGLDLSDSYGSSDFERKNHYLKVIFANDKESENLIVSGWYDKFRNGELITENDTVDNKKVIELQKNLAKFKNLSQREYLVELINNVLPKIGVDLSDKSVDLILESSELISKDFTVNELKKSIDRILNTLSGKENKTEESETSRFGRNNAYLHESKHFLTLAKIKLLTDGTMFSSMYRDQEGKNRYTIFNNSLLSKTFQDLKNIQSNKFKNFLRSDFHKNNNVIVSLAEEDPKFVFELAYFSNFNKEGDVLGGSSFKNLSPQDREYVRFALYFNNNNDTSYFQAPTIESKPTIPLIHTNKLTKTFLENKLSYEVETIFFNAIKAEYSRIQKVKLDQQTLKDSGKLIENYHYVLDDGVRNYEKAQGLLFHYFPSLNNLRVIVDENITAKLSNVSNIESYRKEIVDELNKLINLEIENNKKRFVKYGLLNKKNQLTEKINDPRLSKNKKSNEVLIDYTINYMVHYLNFYQLFSNDIAFVKGYLDMGKRNAMILAPGQDFFLDGNMNTLFINDVEIPSTSLFSLHDSLKRMFEKKNYSNPSERAEAIVKNFKNINNTDAQGYLSLKEYERWLDGLGRLDSDMKIIINSLANNRLSDLTEEQLNKVLQPFKPVYVEDVWDNELNTYVRKYIKLSVIPLFKELTINYPELDKIRIQMESKDIGLLAYRSSVKIGLNNIENFYKDNLVNEFDENNIQELPYSGLRLQQELPYDKDKSEINTVSQARKLKFQDLTDHWFNDVEYNFYGKKMNARELYKQEENLYIAGIQNKSDKFKKEFGIELFEDGYRITNIKKVNEILLKEAVKRGYNENSLYALQLTDDGKNFKIPIWFNPQSEQFETLLLSIINSRIVKTKQNGGSFIQASNQGFSNKNLKTEIDSKTIDKVDWVNEKVKNKFIEMMKAPSLLSFREEEGVLLPEQILLPNVYKKYFKAGSKISVQDLKNAGLLKMFAMRIPNQGHNSMAAVEVAGFLPDSSGDLVIVHQDMLKRMGSDFDVDKLYIYYHNISFEKGKPVKTKYYRNIDSNTSKQLYENLIKESFFNNLNIFEDKFREELKNLNFDINLYNDFFYKQTIGEIPKESYKIYSEQKAQLEDLYSNLSNYRKYIKETLLNEKILLEYEEFEQLSEERKNSSEARENAILDISLEIFSKPEMLLKLTIPNSVDPLRDANDYFDLENKEKDFTIPISISAQDDLYESNSAGKSGIGMTSLWNTIHSQLQYHKVKLNLYKDIYDEDGVFMGRKLISNGVKFLNNKNLLFKEGNRQSSATIKAEEEIWDQLEKDYPSLVIPKEYREFGLYYLGKNRGRVNAEFISNLLQVLQSAAVDNAKELQLNKANLNSDTFNAACYMVAMGVDDLRLIVGLLRQPSIISYVEEIAASRTKIKTYTDYGRIEDLAFEKIRDQYLKKLKEIKHVPKSIVTNIMFIKPFSIKDFEKNLNAYKNEAKLNVKDKIKHYEDQLEMLKAFYSYKDQADSLAKAINAHNIDVSGVGKNWYDVKNSIDRLVKTGIIESETVTKTKVYFSGLNTLSENTYVGELIKNAFYPALEIYNTDWLFPYGKSFFKKAFLETFSKFGVNSPTENNFKILKKYLMTFIASDTNNGIIPYENIENFRKKTMLSSSKRNLGKRLTELKKKITDNYLLERLNISTSKKWIKVNVEKIEFAKQNLEKSEEPYVVNAFLQLLNSNDDESREFAEDLIAYSYLVDGVGQTIKGISHVIPIQYLIETGFGDYYNKFNPEDTNVFGENILFERFLKQFIRNYPEIINKRKARGVVFDGEYAIIPEKWEGWGNSGRIVSFIKLGYKGKDIIFNIDSINENGEYVFKMQPPLGYGNGFIETDVNKDNVISILPANKITVNKSSNVRKDTSSGLEVFKKSTKFVEVEDYSLYDDELDFNGDDSIKDSVKLLNNTIKNSLKKEDIGEEKTPTQVVDSNKEVIEQPIDNKEGIKPNEYINHSGGAIGADSMFDKIGKELGFNNHNHYWANSKTPLGNKELTKEQLEEGVIHAKAAAKELGRPWIDKYANLLGRNWFQVKNSTQVIAIAPIVHPNETNSKGYKVKALRDTVDGGTGYAVEMGIANGKEVNVFNTKDNQWYKWNGTTFEKSEIPTLHKNFAGIGSRQDNGKMTPESIQAIRNVYQKTLNQSTKQTVNNQEGIDFLFEQSPELAKIGSKEQYAQYISTIFPESVVKDIVYHGITSRLKEKFDKFSKEFIKSGQGRYGEDGFFFSENKEEVNKNYNSSGLITAIINLRNTSKDIYKNTWKETVEYLTEPQEIYGGKTDLDYLAEGYRAAAWNKERNWKKQVEKLKEDGWKIEETPNSFIKLGKISSQEKTYYSHLKKNLEKGTLPFNVNNSVKAIKKAKEQGLDGLVYENVLEESSVDKHNQYVVFEPEQIHILSSKKDLEMFRNFINFTKSEYAKYGDIQQFRNYIMSKNFAAIEEFLVVNNKIDRKC